MFSLANLTRSDGDPKIIATGPSSLPGPDKFARGLGWFSIGLGLTELLAPRALTRWLGMPGMEGLVRCFGCREIAAGMLTLSTERRTGVASRVLGDGLDIVALATALGPDNSKRQNAGLALALVAGVTLLDIVASAALADTHARRGNPRDYGDRSGLRGKQWRGGGRGPTADHASRSGTVSAPSVLRPASSEPSIGKGVLDEAPGAADSDGEGDDATSRSTGQGSRHGFGD
ncbi:hypothetical protein LB518_11810 [Mesorhizobium sp. BR1-1-16]|uniref:hypothetical protein n=1 Tax=Mesorhizobium sp. BR1-1-16 TaxID=2876653 RepID=UPI001CC9429A|nr:hypothetical protein [Mesorhizobium sp. BR1-1-16]MBZ9936983.1 hypothetical protein [Mesorhizobium sp. BR1-1-16]